MLGPITALAAGLILGVGLSVSGMIDPAKVLGFLDPFGNWDPSLGLVMAGAVAVSIPAFALAAKRGKPVLAQSFQLPEGRDIDRRLIIGSVVFGVGWGLVGLCPGPAFSSLALGMWPTAVFVAAMIAGMALYRLLRI